MDRLPAPGDSLDERRSFAAVSNALFKAGPLQGAPKVGRYFLLERLGEGGMGVVYSGLDPQLGRKVAIKFLRDRERGQGLIEEGRALANLDHPNVVTVHEVGEDDAGVYLVMAFVDGKTLDRWIERSSPTVAERVELFRDVARGLAAVHAAGLTHRDVKPANILVDHDGTVRLADFGLAIRARAGEEADIEGGTRVYMSPEQASGVGVGPASDQYSFCVCLFEALNGHKPKLDGQEEWTAPVSSRLRRAVERGLRPDPAQRFDSMHELLVELAPSKGWRSVASWSAIAAIVGLGGLGIGLAGAGAEPDPPDPCAGVTADFDAETWNERRRRRIEQTQPDGTTNNAVGGMATYADDWRTSRATACEAYHGGNLSAERFDSKLSCLNQLERELGLFLDAVESAPELPSDALWSGVSNLRSVSLCEVPSDVLARSVGRSESDSQRASLLRAEVEGLSQRARLGLPLALDAESLERRAGEVSDFALRSDTYHLLGATELDRTERRRLYTLAKRAALEGRAPFELSTAFEALGKTLEFDGDLEGAREEFELADSALDSVAPLRETYPELGPQLDLARAQLSVSRGNLARRSGDLLTNLDFQLQAVALYGRVAGLAPLNEATALNNVGEGYRVLGDFARADTAYAAAISRSVDVVGYDAPRTMSVRTNRASMLQEAGAWTEAEAEYRDLVEAAAGGPQATYPLVNLILLAEERDDWEAASETCHAATKVIDAAPEPYVPIQDLVAFMCANQVARNDDGADLGETRTLYTTMLQHADPSLLVLAHVRWAETLVLHGHLGQAAEAAEMAMATSTLPGGSPSPDQPVVERVRGDLARAEGDHEAAKQHYRRALDLLSAAGASDHPRALAPQVGLAELGEPVDLETLRRLVKSGGFQGELVRRVEALTNGRG